MSIYGDSFPSSQQRRPGAAERTGDRRATNGMRRQQWESLPFHRLTHDPTFRRPGRAGGMADDRDWIAAAYVAVLHFRAKGSLAPESTTECRCPLHAGNGRGECVLVNGQAG